MTKSWQRQAVGLAAGACLLTGASAVQAAPTSGLIDLGSITITNGGSGAFDLNNDGLFDFTFSANAGVVHFVGHSVTGLFSQGEGGFNGFGRGTNTIAVNSGGGAHSFGPGQTITGIQHDTGFGEGLDLLYDDFVVDEGGEGGTHFEGVAEGDINVADTGDGFVGGQIYGDGDPQIPEVTVTEPMVVFQIALGEGQNGDTILTFSGISERGNVITTPSASLPEPGAAALLLGGLMGLGAYRSRRKA